MLSYIPRRQSLFVLNVANDKSTGVVYIDIWRFTKRQTVVISATPITTENATSCHIWRCIWGKTLVTYARRIYTIFRSTTKHCRKVMPPDGGGGGGFSRNICGKSFLRKRYLKEDCRCKHQSRNICGKSFLRKRYLKEDCRCKHQSQKQYECEILA